MSIAINFTYWVVTFRYDLVCLTVWSLDSVRVFHLPQLCYMVCHMVSLVCLDEVLNFFTIFVYVSDDDVTFFRFRWIFFNLFINISNLETGFSTLPLIDQKFQDVLHYQLYLLDNHQPVHRSYFLPSKLNVLRLFIVLSSVIRRVVV